MFKSTFSKYLTAFVLIILLSFLMLSGIITSMVRSYVTEDKENMLTSTSTTLASLLETEMLDSYYLFLIERPVTAIINRDAELDIMIVNYDGRVLLSSLNQYAVTEDGTKKPAIFGDLGYVDMTLFSVKEGENGKYLHYKGGIPGLTQKTTMTCATEVVTKGETRGYVLTLMSTVEEDSLVSHTRRAVINSSAWVMLAAVIAVFFITERIIHPLRRMTVAAKRFAKGDFSTRVTVYGHDEVSELGNAFNQMADSLEKLDKMRSSFLASVSHDLRTPMTTIAGFIEGINSGAIPPEKHEYYLGIISAEVHRLSRLVSQLLDVSRLESGDRKFNYTDFDVAELARIILISFENQLEEKRLDVTFESDDDVMSAHADKDSIHQVIYNLCHNAIKFSSEGGRFAISIKRIEDKHLSISVFNEGQTISKEDSKMIFERFYKSDKSRGLDKSGVGLGLYICKTIIDAHGEAIFLKSEEGFGTEFTFTLKEGEHLKRKGQ